jgi:SMI1-KNR4 cell-wall
VQKLELLLRSRADVTVGVGARDLEIENAERLLQVTFPDALCEYLRRFGSLEVGYHEMYGLGSGLPAYLQMVAMTISERTESGCPLPTELVPILNDGGGNLYCVDTRQPNSGRIVLWNHSKGTAQEPEPQSSSLPEWITRVLGELE